jgi:Transcription factor WhiB
MTTAYDDILAAVGAAPALPGAKCRGRHHLFDPAAPNEDPETVSQRHAQALGLCRHCPALKRCQDWFYGLPVSKRPAGVVAGVVRESKP